MAEDQTTIITKPDDSSNGDSSHPLSGESHLFNVTIRGWLAIFLVVTICLSHLMSIIPSILIAYKKMDLSYLNNITTIGEPLYSMSIAALGFYFGQRNRSQNQQTTTGK